MSEQPVSPRRRVKKVEPKVVPPPGVELYDKKAAEAESKERAAELAKVAKIKAERERREKIEAECKRLQIPRLLAVKGEFAPFTSQRTRAVERAQEALQKERMVQLKVVSVKPDDTKEQLFWGTLHGDKNSVGEGVGDNVWELKYNQAFKLYRYDAEIGLMPEEDVSCNKLDKKSIFVVAAPGELYVWYGKETGLLRRNHARAQAIATYKAKPDGETHNPNSWVQIREIHQGSEDYVFRQKFPDWIEMSATGVPLDPHVLLEIFSRKMLDFNPAKVTQIEDVDGSLDIWVAKDHGKVPISKVSYGEFFNGNSYIVLYQSEQGRVVYFWQGSQSHVSWDHAAESIKAVQKIALQSVDLLRRKKTTVPVVRVTEGDEPPHLLALFNGAFIVRAGKFDSFDRRLLLMYHIRGSDPFSCRVTECALSRKALRSDDAFIAYSPKTMFVWRGKNCNEFAYKVAKALSERFVAMDTVKVKEGAEDQAFWDMLGGKIEMKEMEKKRVKGRKCHKCAHGNPVDCRFCRKCGAPMGEKKASLARTSGATLTTSSDSGTVTPSSSDSTVPSGSPPPPMPSSGESAAASPAAAVPPTLRAPSPAKPEDLSSLVGGDALSKKGLTASMAALSVLPGRRSRRLSTRTKGKPVKVCPQCTKSNPVTHRYCRGCGHEMTNVKETSDVSQSEGESSGGDMLRPRRASRSKGAATEPKLAAAAGSGGGGRPCGGCGKANVAGVKFCKYCGVPMQPDAASVDAPMSTNDLLGMTSTALPKIAAAHASLTQPAQVPCEHCGTPNDLTDKFCSSCAEPTKKAVVAAPAAPTTLSAPAELKCPACATVNEVGCKFCLDCGESLQVVQPTALAAPPAVVDTPVSEIKCRVCSTWNEAGCKFCADCGETLVPAEALSSTPASRSESLSRVPLSSTKSEQSADAIKCPKCRRPNATDQKFCRKCGWELAKPRSGKGSRTSSAEVSSSGEGSAAAAAAAAKKEPMQDCRQCGTGNPLHTIFCKKCGTRFSESKPRNPADEIARLRRANSSFSIPQLPKGPGSRGVRCADPACAKPNKPGDAACRVCGKPLPADAAPVDGPADAPALPTSESPAKTPGKATPGKIVIPAAISPASQPQLAAATMGAAGASASKLPPLRRAMPERVDSSAFLKKKDKGALEDTVGDWLKRRDEISSSPAEGGLNASTSTPGKLSIIQAKMKAMEEKAAAEKAKAEEERKKKEEEAAALEARKWVKPKLFIIQDNAIHAKRAVLQVHLRNPATQVVIDAKDVVWVWCGSKTNADQVQFARDLAKFYCDVVLKESNRKAVIKEAKESDADFVKLFQGWDYDEDAPKRQMHHSVSTAAVAAAQPTQPTQPPVGAKDSAAPPPLVEGVQGAAEAVAATAEPVAAPAVEQPAEAAATTTDGAAAAAIATPAAAAAAVATPPRGTTQQVLGMYMCYFPLERLQNPATLPPTLNMGSLETYLTDEDFSSIFKMPKEQFAQLPAWKKVSLKKMQGLF